MFVCRISSKYLLDMIHMGNDIIYSGVCIWQQWVDEHTCIIKDITLHALTIYVHLLWHVILIRRRVKLGWLAILSYLFINDV